MNPLEQSRVIQEGLVWNILFHTITGEKAFPCDKHMKIRTRVFQSSVKNSRIRVSYWKTHYPVDMSHAKPGTSWSHFLILCFLIFLLSCPYFLFWLHSKDFFSSVYVCMSLCVISITKLFPSMFVLRYVYFACFKVSFEIIFLTFQPPSSAFLFFYKKKKKDAPLRHMNYMTLLSNLRYDNYTVNVSVFTDLQSFSTSYHILPLDTRYLLKSA